jgi:hypothetical protein
MIFDEVRRDLEHLLDHERYDQPETTRQEGPVSLATIEQNIRNGVQAVEQHIHEWATSLEPHLGHLADVAATVEASPLVQAALAAVLPPAVEAEITALIAKLHEQFNPAPAEAAAPVDSTPDVPADPQPVPAGPVVGGQAQ